MISSSAALMFAAISALWSQGTPTVQTPAAPPPAITVDRSVLERYVGIYKCELGTAKVAVAKDGRLTLQIDRLRPIPLIADGEAQFRPEGVKATPTLTESVISCFTARARKSAPTGSVAKPDRSGSLPLCLWPARR